MVNPKRIERPVAPERRKDFDWVELGPRLFKSLTEALRDHDGAYMKLPGICVPECWSHEARELIEGNN